MNRERVSYYLIKLNYNSTHQGRSLVVANQKFPKQNIQSYAAN